MTRVVGFLSRLGILRVMQFTRLATGGALALGLLLFTACASVRSTALSLSNSTMTGQVAPPLDDGNWVVAEAWQLAAEPETDWRMLVIFQPS